MDLTPTGLPEPDHIELDGTTVATYLLQPQHHPPRGDVVLCHGTPWSSQVWADAAAQLSRQYRVFLWDMPGYGRSDKEPGVPVGLRHQMGRFHQLVEHWQLDRPHVVAHDIGGAVALGAHLLHGLDYASLFLLDVVALHPWGSPFFRLVAEHEQVFAALPPSLHAVVVKEYIAGAAHHRLPATQVDALTEPWLGETGQAAFYRQIAQLRPEDTEAIGNRLSELRCRSMIGWGEQDPWVPVEQATSLQQLLPGNPPLIEFEGASHLVPIEQPSALNHALQHWLAPSTHTSDRALVSGAQESDSGARVAPRRLS